MILRPCTLLLFVCCFRHAQIPVASNLNTVGIKDDINIYIYISIYIYKRGLLDLFSRLAFSHCFAAVIFCSAPVKAVACDDGDSLVLLQGKAACVSVAYQIQEKSRSKKNCSEMYIE